MRIIYLFFRFFGFFAFSKKTYRRYAFLVILSMNMCCVSYLILAVGLYSALPAYALVRNNIRREFRTNLLRSLKQASEEYTNPLTSFLGVFIQQEQQVPVQTVNISSINWNAKKRKFLSIDKMVAELERGISKTEWFVTGLVDPSLFSETFSFKDPDVKLNGIQQYAEGVYKIFDQSCSRAEVIRVEKTANEKGEKLITVTWRLEGRIRVGPGLKIKPYIVYTDFKLDKEGLICFQEDRFSIPGYDILLSALFPFPIPFLSPPAPSADILRKSLKAI